MILEILFSLGMGCAGYFIARTLNGALQTRKTPQQHEQYRDAVLQELNHAAALRAEIADSDQRLVNLWHDAPDGQARWIVACRDQISDLAPRLIELGRRFGFRLPPPGAGDPPERPAERPEAADGSTVASADEAATAGQPGLAWVGSVPITSQPADGEGAAN
jgi:hypothetical protein